MTVQVTISKTGEARIISLQEYAKLTLSATCFEVTDKQRSYAAHGILAKFNSEPSKSSWCCCTVFSSSLPAWVTAVESKLTDELRSRFVSSKQNIHNYQNEPFNSVECASIIENILDEAIFTRSSYKEESTLDTKSETIDPFSTPTHALGSYKFTLQAYPSSKILKFLKNNVGILVADPDQRKRIITKLNFLTKQSTLKIPAAEISDSTKCGCVDNFAYFIDSDDKAEDFANLIQKLFIDRLAKLSIVNTAAELNARYSSTAELNALYSSAAELNARYSSTTEYNDRLAQLSTVNTDEDKKATTSSL